VLHALRIAAVVLTAGSLLCAGLAVREALLHSVFATVYAGLASMGMTMVGAGAPLYFHLRRADPATPGT
jgi:hypothetical protein